MMFIKTDLDQFRNGLFEKRIKEILKCLEARPANFSVSFQRVLKVVADFFTSLQASSRAKKPEFSRRPCTEVPAGPSLDRLAHRELNS